MSYYCQEERIHHVEYVDDIVITGDNATCINDLKGFTQRRFHTKNLGKLQYFFSTEVARSKKEIYLSQRKYTLKMLSEAGMS